MVDYKAFRKANNLTQGDVADYLGCKKAFICQIEKGLRPMPQPMYSKLLHNTNGWSIAELSDGAESIAEEQTTDTTDEAVVITSQVLEEMTASRQLAEQALAMVQEQLEAKQQTILAVREQLATTQEQLSTSQEQLTTEQRQTSIAQQQITAEQQQVAAEKETTRALLEDIKMGRQQLQAVIDRESRQQDEFFMLLRKQEARFEQEMERMEARIDKLMHHKEHHKEEHDHQHHPHKHSNNNDA